MKVSIFTLVSLILAIMLLSVAFSCLTIYGIYLIFKPKPVYDVTPNFTENYTAAGHVAIDMDTSSPSTDIVISRSNSSDIELEAFHTGFCPRVNCTRDGDNLALKIFYATPSESDSPGPHRAEHLHLPGNATYDISIYNSNGNVYVQDFDARSLEVHNRIGQVTIDGSYDRLSVKCLGPISACFSANSSYFETYYQPYPVWGMITLNITAPAGSHQAKAAYGNLIVELPADGRPWVNATASNGTIGVGKPLGLEINDTHHARSPVINGTTDNFSIELATAKGDIRIK